MKFKFLPLSKLFKKPLQKPLTQAFSYFIIFTITFFVIFGSNPNSANAYKAYQGVRKTNNNDCSSESGGPNGEPCYVNRYNSSEQKCDVGELRFNPYISTPGNPHSMDYNMDFSNKACLAYASTAGGLLVMDLLYSQAVCDFSGAGIAAFLTNLAVQGASFGLGFLGPEFYPLANTINVECATRTAQVLTGGCDVVGAFNPALTLECKRKAITCCIGAARIATHVGLNISALAIIHAKANDAFHNNTICGQGWYEWKENPETKIFKKQKSQYGRCLDYIFNGFVSEIDKDDPNFKESCKAMISNHQSEVTNQNYRQYLYGGYEFGNDAPSACKNPDSLASSLGYRGGNQIYYMRGPSEEPNFACERFAMGGLKNLEEVAAFECCKRAAKYQICIKTGNQPANFDGSGFGGMNSVQSGAIVGAAAGATTGPLAPVTVAIGAGVGAGVGAIVGSDAVQSTKKNVFFCELGTTCFANAVEYQIYNETVGGSDYTCARTISVCPYDHLLSGGTTEQLLNSNNNKISNRKIAANFCQYMRHCSKVPMISDIDIPDFSGLYVSSTCFDQVGDSQLSYQYAGSLLPVSNRSFSAPLVQCFKETIENSFLGLAGHSICSVPDENPDPQTGICPSGNIATKNTTYNEEPFFVKLQKSLRFVVKFVLLFSVMMFGVAIFLALPDQHLGKKAVLTFLIKFALVAYFSLGDAWMNSFYRAAINVPGSMMDLTFHPRNDLSSPNIDKNDGCNFPRYNYLLKSSPNNNPEKYRNPQYQPGKDYLRPWDTLDCKLSRALGYGPEVSVPNIAIMIATGVFFGPMGVMFFLAGFSLFFLLLYIVIRCAHIFLMSITATTLLIYISPLTIPTILFEKTKSVFENWWKQIFGFVFQPMILFAYLGMLLTVIDMVLIGSARFNAGGGFDSNIPDIEGRRFPKIVNCSPYYVDKDNNYAKEGDYTMPEYNWKLKDPRNDSIYCMMDVPNFENYNGFEIFDIGFPILKSLNKEKLNTLFKLAILLFVFFTFLEKITYIAAKLVGGSELKSDWNPQVQGKIAGFMSGIQNRALRGIKKWSGKAGSAVGNAVRRNASYEPRNSDPEEVDGGDAAGRIEGAGGDNAGRIESGNNDAAGNIDSSQNSDFAGQSRRREGNSDN